MLIALRNSSLLVVVANMSASVGQSMDWTRGPVLVVTSLGSSSK